MRFTRISIASLALGVASAGLGAPAATGSVSSAAQVAKYHVTLQISAKEAVAGEDKVKLTGTVTPKPPEGSKVVLQVKYENKTAWKRLASTTIKASGAYKFVEKPGTSLDRVYRVVKASDAVATADKSRERALSVTKWQWITSLAPSAVEAFAGNGTVPINGDDYAHTLFAYSTESVGFTEFTLGRDCLTLEATFGLSDRTETGGRAILQVRNDGVLAYDRNFGLGESEAKTIDVSDVYRLRIDFAQVPETPATEPSVGAGRILCD
jgi:NPCBM/NEW2 domain